MDIIELQVKANNVCNGVQDMIQYILDSVNLENMNTTDEAKGMSLEEDNAMAYKRLSVKIGNDKNGKPLYIQISGSTQDERNDNIVKAYIKSGRIWEFLPMLQAPLQQESKSKHSFEEYSWEWYVVYKKDNISTKYKATLEARIKRLCRFFGKMNIEDITVETVQRFLSSVSSLTKETVGYYRNALSQILDSAVEDGYVDKNPTKSKRLKINGTEANGNKALSAAVCQQLISCIPNLQPNESMCIGLMLYAGLRREEMLGIQWEDIDFKRHSLYINRAVIFGNDGKPEVKTTKNKSSKRVVPISDDLANILFPNKKEKGFVITNLNGDLFIDRQYKTFWSNLKKHVGIPDLDARELRHTYATINAAAGVDMKTIGGCMGHSKIATTAEIYTQLESTHVQDIRNKMSEYIRNIDG